MAAARGMVANSGEKMAVPQARAHSVGSGVVKWAGVSPRHPCTQATDRTSKSREDKPPPELG
eukprot:827882-Prymnesium_polylepis.1